MRFFFLLFCLLNVMALAAQSLTPEIRSHLDSILLKPARGTGRPGYAVCIVQGDQIVYEAQVGMANIGKGIPVRANTVFNIGSMAKQFTAMCIFLLEEEGRLRIDDPIHKYLPELPDYGQPITIAQLMSHSSGIRDHVELMVMTKRFKWRKLTAEHLFDYQQKVKTLNFAPGTDFAYCNTAYMMLAFIVERVSGQSMGVFAQERIFGPLGMVSTRFQDDFFRKMPDGTRSYVQNRKKNTFKPAERQKDALGATGVHSTARDLALWEQNFYHNKLGKGGHALIQRMETVIPFQNGSSSGYGGGLFIRNYRGYREIEHSGGWAYYMTQCRRFPEERLSVIVLCNNSFDSPFAINEQICRVLLPAKNLPTIVSDGSVVPFPLDSFCGVYLSHNNLVRYVRIVGNQLCIGQSAQIDDRQIRLHYQSFAEPCAVFADSAGNEIRFHLEKGNVKGMGWGAGGYFNSQRYYSKMPNSSRYAVASRAGKYRSVDIGKRVKIKYNKRKHQLSLVPFPFVKYRLEHVTDHVFRIAGEAELIRFEGNAFLLGNIWNQQIRFER
jgi:CubicO group peptidase (beta-lactamase class C family)